MLKKVLIIFTTNIENVNHVILKEVQNVTLKIKIKYQMNINYIMKKK